MIRLLASSSILLALSGCGTPTAGPLDEGVSSVSLASVAGATDDGVVFRFASRGEAADVLTRDDLYTNQVQAREAGIRARDASVTSFEGVAPIYETDVLDWTEDEMAALSAAIETTLPKINRIDSLLPDEVLLVKTGDLVEGGLPHTRSNAIIFAGGGIPSGDQLTALFLHELHHVLSRLQEERHDAYYALIGFQPCSFSEPEGLRLQRLSNPDAPVYLHYVPVENPGTDGVIPFLYASRDYSGEGALPDYFGFGLVPVAVTKGRCTSLAMTPADLLAPQEARGFLEALGGNTGYIIHPEETLADNFVFWVMDRQDLATPELPQRVGEFWLNAAQE